MGILSTVAALFASSCRGQDVRVEFINTIDNISLGVVDLALDKLPDTFAVDTTFDIADKKWSVTKAEPVTKTEFAKTRRLRVFLAPVTSIPARGLLFSLPTISDDIGRGEGTAPPDDTVFQILEDDWRQTEFVARVYEKEIASELEDIRKIYADRKPGGGFVSVHIRKRIPVPLGTNVITVADLRRILPPKREYRAVGIHRSLGTFQQSFAWDIDEGLTVWGTKDNTDRIRIVCIAFGKKAHHSPELVAALAHLCSDRNLYLVDWCRAAKGSTPEDLQALTE